MMANLGFWTQAAVTHKSLVDNVNDHIADPGHNNSVPWRPAALAAAPVVLLHPFLALTRPPVRSL